MNTTDNPQAGFTVLELVIGGVMVALVISLAVVAASQALNVTNKSTRTAYYATQAQDLLDLVCRNLQTTSRDQLGLMGPETVDGETFYTQATYKRVVGFDVDAGELVHEDEWSFVGQRWELAGSQYDPGRELHLVDALASYSGSTPPNSSAHLHEISGADDELVEATRFSGNLLSLRMQQPNGPGTREITISLALEFEDWETGETFPIELSRTVSLRN